MSNFFNKYENGQISQCSEKEKLNVARSSKLFPKAATGIEGLDEILGGGLPQGRTTLLYGTTGSGKTLLAMEFLVWGATLFGEPGVLMVPKEAGDELAQKVASLGFDLPALVADKKILVEFMDKTCEDDAGGCDTGIISACLEKAIDLVGARRVVLDTMEPFFCNPVNPHGSPDKLQYLYRRLGEKGVTTMITARCSEAMPGCYGRGEYISDCVICLDCRAGNKVSTRYLRVLGAGGSVHDAYEYPFIIDGQGIVVIPTTLLDPGHAIPTERVSSGIARLDTMLKGGGFYRASTLLVSGGAGTGKTTVAIHFAEAACQRGERVLFFALDESPGQIIRNMHSIGMELESWVKKGLLRFVPARPYMYGPEKHLAAMYRHVGKFQPEIVIADSINVFVNTDNGYEVGSMLAHLADYLKSKGITILFTSLSASTGGVMEHTNISISPLIDTWLQLSNREDNGEYNRGIFILKSRGMAHSNQIREFLITDHGIELMDVYLGPGGMLAGSARLEEEARAEMERLARWQETERRQRELERKRHALEAQISSLREAFSNEEAELMQTIAQEQLREVRYLQDRLQVAKNRHADEDQQKEILNKGI